ncbi:MAG TPA: PilT/PilU family type 4a pilus ATPase [Nitrospirae bacterium]|nr:PilT/PilU family type 4a pilus ATPase [Nitrospirota bacterium]
MEDVIENFRYVLVEAVKQQASDIHMCVGTVWKYRINGNIVPLDMKPLEMGECEVIVKHILSNLRGDFYSIDDIDTAAKKLKDLDCTYSMPNVSRFRVNICRQRGTFSVVLRVIPFNVPTIESLGLPEVINDIALEQRGLILVTGVTGSGKSTTLAAMINKINETKPCKIVAIEDPIEYLHNEKNASIIQREIGSDTDSYSIALRASVRQDPDIILLGEMRDIASVETALNAAETGRLVMSTLHTVDAPKTIQRIISSFDMREQMAIRVRLAESLQAVISQRLIPRIDKTGRIAVVEIMKNTLSIKDCIENPDKTSHIKELMSSGKDQYKMQTFDQHLSELYEQGIVDLETAKAAATSASDFERNVTFT